MNKEFEVILNQLKLDSIKTIVASDQLMLRDPEFTQEIKNQMISLIQNKGKYTHQKVIQNIIHDQSAELQLSREEIFVLLSMMYFQLFSRKFMEGRGFYRTDMNYLKRETYKSQQKLKCIFSYFKHYLQNEEKIKNQFVIFTKKTETSEIELRYNGKANGNVFEKIQFSNGKNEDQKNAIIVDFADENIGGLVLDPANIAQEEVLMLIYPEAIVSMLFITPMQVNQAILIENLIQYNDYQGYESTFKWVQKEFNEKDINHMLAIDAKPFQSKIEQLRQENITREFKKCLIGFSLALQKKKNLTISTGKWGCGIFNGDSYLKTLIQLAAFLIAAENNYSTTSKIIINTVGDEELNYFGQQIKEKFLNLKDLITMLTTLPVSGQQRNFMDLMLESLSQQNVKSKQSKIKQLFKSWLTYKWSTSTYVKCSFGFLILLLCFAYQNNSMSSYVNDRYNQVQYYYQQICSVVAPGWH